MRYGLLADVHANLPALEAGIAALREQEVERFIHAGDAVGYGPQPNECIERLRELDAVCVTGNHELIALGALPEEGIHPWAAQTLSWTRDVLTAENRAWLEGLPLRLDLDDGVSVAHGSLTETRTYVNTPQRARKQLDALAEGAILVLGHTHEQMEFHHRGRLLVNPGAVGQSRARRVAGHVAVLDRDPDSVRLLEFQYDTSATRAALARNGLPTRTYHLRKSPARRAWLRLPVGVRRVVKRAVGR